MFLGISIGFALRMGGYGAGIGASLGALRSWGDAMFDETASPLDVALRTLQGAATGGALGFTLGFGGAYLGAMHFVFRALAFGAGGALSIGGIASDHAKYRQAVDKGNYGEATWQGAWFVVDSILAMFTLGIGGGATSIRSGNQSNAYKGGSPLPGSTNVNGSASSGGKLLEFNFNVIQFIFAKAGIKITQQPLASSSRPTWVDPGDLGAFNSAKKEIWLKHDATWATLLHELGHAVHFLITGPKYPTDKIAREQAAFDFVRSYFWQMLNQSEQGAHSRYINNSGGKAW
jgi:hypothetical protein